MKDFVSWGDLLISFCSLVVSIIALWKSSRVQDEANKLQRKLVYIEEQRERDQKAELLQANLHTQLIKVGKGYRLFLHNSGKAEARNIRIKLDGVSIENHCAFVKGSSIPSCIGPDSEVSLLLAISLDCYPPFVIEVQWDDDYSKDRVYNRVYKSTLTF